MGYIEQDKETKELFEHLMGEYFQYEKNEFGDYSNLLTTACYVGFKRAMMYHETKQMKENLRKIEEVIYKGKHKK